jgi:hypothetical protein
MNVTKTLSSNVTKIANKAGAAINNIKTSAIKVSNSVGSAVKEKADIIQKKVEEVTKKEEVAGPISKWSTMTQEFLNSNTAISKFVGFFLCLLLFIILYQIGMGLIQ